MNTSRPYTESIALMREAGLRPTRQRLGLARLLFEGGNRHVSAENLRDEAEKAGLRVSLATVYNTLHQFTEAGLLRQVVVDPGRTYFDTNTSGHHHFFIEDGAELVDIVSKDIEIKGIPEAPQGTRVARVDVVVRVQRT